MYIYENRTNLAYDLTGEYDLKTFDVDEGPKKKERHIKRLEPVNASAAKQGNWQAMLLCAALAVVAGCSLMVSKVMLNEAVTLNNNASAELEEVKKENSRLQAELDAKITTAKVEEFAENELGLQKTQTSQVTRIGVNTEKIAEVAEAEETDILGLINAKIDEVLEYLGFK